MRTKKIKNKSNSIYKIGCAIPCFKGGKSTIKLIEELHELVDLIVLVDDSCPFLTGDLAKKHFKESKKLKIIYNDKNSGVGYSVKRAFKFLMDSKCDIVVKIDADGQMDPYLIPTLIKPIELGFSDAVKGNRFSSLDHINSMPNSRKIGNLGLSFMNKFSTGYWELFDPTNGFIAFKSDSLKKIRLDKTNSRYFFESDLLFQSSLSNICFSQIPMKSTYKKEISSLNPYSQFFIFLFFHIINFFKRIVYQYFLLDFNIGTLEIIGFFITSLILLFNILNIYRNGINYQQLASPGEANLISILAIISMQLLIGFFYFDATQQPLLRRLNQKRNN
tara:strand:- start:9150 stop:10148 length:999 start_codon:yes stop_codon:yes gene_type:complete